MVREKPISAFSILTSALATGSPVAASTTAIWIPACCASAGEANAVMASAQRGSIEIERYGSKRALLGKSVVSGTAYNGLSPERDTTYTTREIFAGKFS